MKIVVGGQIDKQDIANIIKAELGEGGFGCNNGNEGRNI